MREKSSSLLKNKRRRHDSSSSPENPKQTRVSSDSDNNPSRNDRVKVRSKVLLPETVSPSQDSDSDLEAERRLENKRKKHDNYKRKERNSDSEDDLSRGKTRVPRTNEKSVSRNEEDDARINERESQNNKYSKHKKEQEFRVSSEEKIADNNRRKERYRHDREDENSGREGCSRYVDRRTDSSDSSRRLQHNDRPHDRGENGNDRRKNNRQDYQRDEKGGFQGRDGRRNRWSDGGERSRGGPSRRGHHSRGEQAVRFDPARPIKKEPDENNEEDENYEWGRQSASGSNPTNKNEKNENKEKPNFGLSGKLTEDTNTFNGVVIKYNEPPEARKPRRRWRLYVFKGEESLPTLYLHRQSCFLIGRDRKVVDVPVDHPSCSKQHAAFQFRLVPYERVDGTMGKRVRPYIIDLESANGTYVNNNQIESKKYVELLERDVLKFGFSSREYVLLHEQSKEEEAEDDDVVGT